MLYMYYSIIVIKLYQSTSIEKCYAILLYHPKKPLYYLYHPILQYLSHPKTLFLLKYYSLIFLYYFFLTNTFFFQFHFPRLSNRFFFPQPPSTFSTGSSHRTTHTDPSTEPHIATHTNPSTEPHTQTHHQSQQRPPHPPPKPPIRITPPI